MLCEGLEAETASEPDVAPVQQAAAACTKRPLAVMLYAASC